MNEETIKIVENNYIKDVCNQTIDFSKVECVGPISGDPAWLKYTVYFTGGNTIDFYQERKYADNYPLNQIKREDFVEMWRKSIK